MGAGLLDEVFVTYNSKSNKWQVDYVSSYKSPVAALKAGEKENSKVIADKRKKSVK